MSVITLTEVGDPVKQGKFFYVPLEYNDNGKSFKKKIMDFSNREVYNTMKSAKAGESYKVEVEKDNNGYWQWKTVTKVEGGSSGAGVVDRSTLRSGYETPEERAKRQVYIARQSSLSNALKFFEVVGQKDVTAGDVTSLAQEFTDFVMGDTNGSEASN